MSELEKKFSALKSLIKDVEPYSWTLTILTGWWLYPLKFICLAGLNIAEIVLLPVTYVVPFAEPILVFIISLVLAAGMLCCGIYDEIYNIFTIHRKLQTNLMVTIMFPDVSTTTKNYLRKLDPATILLLKLFVPRILKSNDNPRDSSEVNTRSVDLGWVMTGNGFTDWKKGNVRVLKKYISDKFSTTQVNADDLTGDFNILDFALPQIVRNNTLFPLLDKFVWASDDEMPTIAKDLGLVEGEALPVSYDSNFDMLSDESFSRLFFYSLCAPLVATIKEDNDFRTDFGPYVVDLELDGIDVRPGARPMGCRIHFGKDQVVKAIYDHRTNTTLTKHDDGWENAKLNAKISAVTLVTAREHLIWSHLIVSNTLTTAMILKLAPSHPLRRLLTIFTFNANGVNLNAFNILVTENGLFHRGTSYSYEGMKAVFDHSYESCNQWEPFTEHQLAPSIKAMADNGKFPYITEGRMYWNKLYKFVSNWVKEAGAQASDEQAMDFYKYVQDSTQGQSYQIPYYSSDEDMIKLITQAIYTVTGHHELIGYVVEAVKLPSRAGLRVTDVESQDRVDLQSWIYGAIIGGATSVRMPKLMAPFKNFFGEGGAPAWERILWNDFIADLEILSKDVGAANKLRSTEYNYSNPKQFESSISV